MPTERQRLEAAIDGLESQRTLLGDTLVDMALAPLQAKLAALASPQRADPSGQSLKQVTILFLDVVGSTTLSARLDSEQTAEVMDGALARFTEIVNGQCGKVLNYAGDSVLAVFGADGAREDDAERAVRAGLALVDEGRRIGARVRDAHGHDGFDVRVGVHTGGVLLGGGVGAEPGIHGMAVNVAARMEQTAPAGALRISHATYRHVRGVFDVEPRPPLVVKGLDEPIATYLVKGVKPRAFRVPTRGIEGVETRMIGRDAELARLQDAFTSLFVEPRLAIVTVVADAGVGKSRLLYEFDNWTETQPEPFVHFQGRALPRTEREPYGLLRDILAWRVEIGDGDSMDVAKAKLASCIAPLFAADDGDDLAEAHAHLLGHLIGFDFAESRHVAGITHDGRQIRDRAFHVAAQVFRRIAAREGAPIVLLLEDLHWADEGSLDFLDYLVRVSRDVPMLVLALTRPTLFERRGEWGAAADPRQRIDLAPLDKDASRLLTEELLKNLAEVPDALRELVTGGADGNPFYMEELIKMLVDDGAIDTGGERWTVNAAALVATHVPQTLTGVLQARLDGLKPEEKLALQQASVLGVAFWDDGLAAIAPLAVEALPALMRRELIVSRQGASAEGVREFAFRHQILHHVTYDTLLRRTRREWHARAAVWMSALGGARAGEMLGATAEHFALAGDDGNAAEFYTRAAERAAGRLAYEVAAGFIASAFARLGDRERPEDLSLRWRLVVVRQSMHFFQGKRAEYPADLDALQRLADALDDDRLRAEVARLRSSYSMVTADYTSMERHARQMMRLGEAVGDIAVALRGQRQLALALARQGDHATAWDLASDGLARARRLGLRAVEASLLNVLSIALSQRGGNLMESLDLDRQQLAISRALGDRRDESTTLFNIGWGWLTLGEHREAGRHLESALQLIRALGLRLAESYPLHGVAVLALRRGDATSALAHAESALDIAREVEDRHQELIVLLLLGQALVALGRHDEARTVFSRARAMALDGESVYRYDTMAGLAHVALLRGDVAGALLELEGVLAHLADGGTLEGAEQPCFIKLVVHRAFASAGDPRASRVLADAYSALRAAAGAITDTGLRQSFLDNIPEHRDIVAAWDEAQRRAQAAH